MDNFLQKQKFFAISFTKLFNNWVVILKYISALIDKTAKDESPMKKKTEKETSQRHFFIETNDDQKF